MSAIDATNATSAIQAILLNVPPGANPWQVLRLALGSQVNWRVSSAFRPQMYALSGLLILAALLLVSSLVVRIARRSFWLAAAVRNSRGKIFLTTHYLSVWTTFMCMFLALLQGFIWKTIEKSRGNEAHYIVLWETLTWIPPWLAFWFATSSLMTAHVIHRDSAGRAYQSFWASAWLVNAATWTVPILVIVLITTLAGKAQKEFDGVRFQYSQLLELLTKAEKGFDGTIDYDIIQAGTSRTQEFLNHMTTFVRFFRAVFFAYTGLTLTLMITYGLTSLLHLSELSRSMEALTKSNEKGDDRAQDQLFRTYSTLVRLTILICALLAFFSAIFLYVFSVLGLPIAILLLHRALTSSPNPNGSAPELAHPSQVDSTDRLASVPVEVEARSSPSKEALPLQEFKYEQQPFQVDMAQTPYAAFAPAQLSHGYFARTPSGIVSSRSMPNARVAAEPM
ncbi:hypothetical protein OIV83_004872 [Microbotryomycetes sp. JL201]|nr:hypothetical protein OIV83_004872 [Microbotryomycetes sp. JL201]